MCRDGEHENTFEHYERPWTCECGKPLNKHARPDSLCDECQRRNYEREERKIKGGA